MTAQKITLLALDVDGVMTDGQVVYGNSGEEIKAFNIKDGLGIKLLQKAGVEVAIITGRTSAVVERRAGELGITCIVQGREDKRSVLLELMAERELEAEQVAYMGDDLPDLAAIVTAGIGACPSDAAKPVRDAADWISSVKGGHGAVRELAEMLLQSKGDWDDIVAGFDA
jgi:3-deoxy-D-manno-octulosonate 8-phosphate phosphatase (KDO 8-P phosphatase)